MMGRIAALVGSLLRALLPSRWIVRAADYCIALGNQFEKGGEAAKACEQYLKAVQIAPRYAAAHLNLGIGLEATGDKAAARAAYDHALALEPREPFANFNLAKLLYTSGDREAAESPLLVALASNPGMVEARVLLAALKEDRGELAAAAAELEAALESRPDYIGALLNLASLLARLDRHAAAAERYEAAIALEPGNAEAHWRLGNVLADQGRLDDAARHYAQAIALRPLLIAARHSACLVAYEVGRTTEAIAELRKLTRDHPKFVDAHVSLGMILSRELRLDEAAQAFSQAIQVAPTLAAAHLGLGATLGARGAASEARACYARATELDPENVQARWALMMSWLEAVYDNEAAARESVAAFSRDLDEMDRWLTPPRAKRAVDPVGNPPPFLLAYREQNNREPLRRYGALACRVMEQWREGQQLPEPKRGVRGSPLRVGVVSAHLQYHSVWNALVQGWFRHLDRSRFSIEAFSLGTESDGETQVARALATYFEQGHTNPRSWAQAIAARSPDVLIYPEVGMNAMTLKLASLRLAPVQLASWGHPETTGLPTIDWFLSAEGLEPDAAQDAYTERLALLPGLGCCYADRELTTAPPGLAGLSLAPGTRLLICPGTPFKYAPAGDALLADIAARVPGSRLVFFTYRVEELSRKLHARLRAAFAARGLDADQSIVFLPWLPVAQFRGLMQQSHVFLDTVGFSGFNTAIEAIDCGLPIVTREGKFLRGRLASGILKRLGLAELIAHDDAAYVDIAVRLCNDEDYRMSIRDRMRATRHVLFEDRAPIRALEDLLERVARAQ